MNKRWNEVSEIAMGVSIARANLPALARAEIESLRADLEHECDCTAQLYALNCQLAARLEELRAENQRLKAQLKPDVNYLDWL